MGNNMRKQYHLRPSPNGFYAWDVDNLIEKAKSLKVFNHPINNITEISENHWYQDKDNIPTCKSIINHMKLIQEADLKYPIILSSDGHVMDGMHRIAKAILENHKTITAVKFPHYIQPDFVDVKENELEY
jgi:hypothetical protein